MAMKLKPCPFCGGKAKIYELNGGYFAGCYECLANIGLRYGDKQGGIYRTPEGAAEFWNERAVITDY